MRHIEPVEMRVLIDDLIRGLADETFSRLHHTEPAAHQQLAVRVWRTVGHPIPRSNGLLHASHYPELTVFTLTLLCLKATHGRSTSLNE
ncbi:MAG: hypothetical protein PVG14_07215 [Anaerolineales bacterium]